jgi:hypothetical protein
MLIEVFVPLGVSIVGSALYMARREGRIEGRLTAHDQLFVEREKLASERHKEVKEDLQEIKSEVKRLAGTLLASSSGR